MMADQKKINYDEDFYAWSIQQAHFIKTKAFANLDIEHLFDEVEGMGKSQQKELKTRLEILLIHLLKWKYQPDMQSSSWKYTIKEQRKEIQYHLEDNPSLKNKKNLALAFERAYSLAIYHAAKETGLTENTFPKICEWAIEQILADDFYPA